jgi:hypothetical protein
MHFMISVRAAVEPTQMRVMAARSDVARIARPVLLVKGSHAMSPCSLKTLAIGGILGATFAVSILDASARPARCVIDSSGAKYAGRCDFQQEGAGFSLSPLGRSGFPGGIDPIAVSVLSPGTAEVRGLTKEGVNSRWGEAKRSKKDPACWVGADFKICAY